MMNKVELTEHFLRQISYHLSGKSKYARQEYEVLIYQSIVDCFPPAEVFPDIHHRHMSDKNFVLYHVLKYHMPAGILTDSTLDTSIDCIISPNYLVPGHYRYCFKYSIDGKQKRRTWVKVNSLWDVEN